jgi:Ca2+-transporting ATPase
MRTRVRRGSRTVEIPAQEIVPGDIVLVASGDIVTADLRIIEARDLDCDESTLTGESVPVSKSSAPVPAESPLSERASMLFKGTAITRGSGTGVATATGMSTELGRISALAESAEGEVSPLETRLDRLGSQLVWATLILMPAIFASGVYSGHPILDMVKTAVALAVAAVPEGLPIVATVALARGMWRMARRNALIERLAAVETLGATTVILTDKTGTLTQNRMTVVELLLPEASVQVSGDGRFQMNGAGVDPRTDAGLRAALEAAVLCNEVVPDAKDGASEPKRVGDPMELALLEAGRKAGLEQSALLRELPCEREEAFSSDTKMMATWHRLDNRMSEGRENGGYLVAVKGAPEAVIARAATIGASGEDGPLDDAGRDRWRRRVEELAGRGLRVLGLAMKETDSVNGDPYEGLRLLGLVALVDPPRPDVAGALEACRTAGVRVAMLTGDHAATARKIAGDVRLNGDGPIAVIEARELGRLESLSEEDRRRILEARVFARISPETKLELVSLYQAAGHVVAMTGDGVNDAPALKKADIGIAMGRRGTQVACEAADMVLRDDAFPSIVAAMFQGRVIFDNIRKFVVYLMSCNISEILVIGVATTAGLPLPLLPLQILYLNLVTDVFPAFALGVGPGDADVMRRPPRDPKEPILGRRRWLALAGYAGLITVATLGAFVVALRWLGMPEDRAVTVAFLTLAFAQIWHVFNMRARGSTILRNEITRNPFVWGAVVLCVGLVYGAVRVPRLASVLSFSIPDQSGWALAVGASFVPLIVGQVLHAFRGRKAEPSPGRDV